MTFAVDISIAFLIIGFLAISAGVLLFSIPIGLVVTGLMLSGAGIALLQTGAPE